MARHCQAIHGTRPSTDGLGPRLAPNNPAPEVRAYRRMVQEQLVVPAGDVLWRPSKESASDPLAGRDPVPATGVPKTL